MLGWRCDGAASSIDRSHQPAPPLVAQGRNDSRRPGAGRTWSTTTADGWFIGGSGSCWTRLNEVLSSAAAWEVSRVPEVDPSDDSIWRWVLHHYRFDPERRQRRNVVVAAYDNEAEFDAALSTYSQRIQAEIVAGARDDAEHVGGVVWPPGDHDAQARGRTLRNAFSHGVDPRRVDPDGPVPTNKVFFGWDSDGTPWSLGGGEPPQPPYLNVGTRATESWAAPDANAPPCREVGGDSADLRMLTPADCRLGVHPSKLRACPPECLARSSAIPRSPTSSRWDHACTAN